MNTDKSFDMYDGKMKQTLLTEQEFEELSFHQMSEIDDFDEDFTSFQVESY